jgi:hypothetical protein
MRPGWDAPALYKNIRTVQGYEFKPQLKLRGMREIKADNLSVRQLLFYQKQVMDASGKANQHALPLK